MDRLHSFLLIASIVIFTVSTVQYTEAANFGSVVKTNDITLVDGKSGSFDILFWNSEPEPYDVSLKVVEAPEEISVIVNPDFFSVSSSEGSEKISIQSKYINARLVKVFVKPEKIGTGSYKIKIIASSIPNENGIVFLQERFIELNLNVIGPSVTQNVDENIFIENSYEKVSDSEILEPETEHTPEETNYLLYAIATIGILSIAYVVYRYA